MYMRTAALIIVPLIIAFFLYQAFSNQTIEEEVAQAQKPIHPETMAAYQNNCASCHGVNLQGQEGWQNILDEDGHRLAPPLNGTGHTWHHSPEYLFQVIKYGFPSFDPNYEGKMLGNSDLSDKEVWELVSYMKEVWPDEIKEVYEIRFGS